MKHKLYILVFLMAETFGVTAQTTEEAIKLTLEEAITTAIDSSLTSLLAQNNFLASYWQYRSYQVERLPSLSFTSTPIQYYQNFVKRYDSQNNIDVYKQQKSIYSSAGLQANQKCHLDRRCPVVGNRFRLYTKLRIGQVNPVFFHPCPPQVFSVPVL